MADGVDGAAAVAGTGAGGAIAAGRGDWRALDRRLRRLARRRAADDLEEAACLRRARAEGLHRRFGYASFYEYAERVLGYTPGVVRERMRVADALVGLPKLRAALTAGEVPYSAARQLTRVATGATEEAWLAATARARVREVEDMVRGRRLGDPPDAPPDPAARLHERRFLLTGAALGAYVAARARLETACGHSLTDSEVMEALCAASLAGPAATDPATRPPPYQIAITRCADCARAWVDAAGQTIELSATELARVSCDAELLGRVDGDAPPRATKTIPPRIRRAVLRRDRGRCRVPGCTNARFVDVHHVVPRAKGGDHTPSRLAAMCSAHHQAAHDGRLKVDLDKRGRLRVAHADGRPYGSPPPPHRAAKTGVTKPRAAKPRFAKSRAAELRAAKPHAAKPRFAKLRAAKLRAAKQGAATPRVSKLSVAKPRAAKPGGAKLRAPATRPRMHGDRAASRGGRGKAKAPAMRRGGLRASLVGRRTAKPRTAKPPMKARRGRASHAATATAPPQGRHATSPGGPPRPPGRRPPFTEPGDPLARRRRATGT